MQSKNFWGALILFTLLVAFPILSNPFAYKYGPNLHGSGSDSYALLKDFSLRADPELKKYVVNGVNSLEGFPQGVKLAPLLDFPTNFALVIAKATHSAVFGYNCSVLLSFILMFLFSALFLKRHIQNEGVRLLYATLLSYTPFQILQSVDHLTLSYLFLFPALFYFWEELLDEIQFSRNAMLIVLTQGLSVFFHPYFFIMVLLMNLIFVCFYLKTVSALAQKNLNIKKTLQFITISVVMIALVFLWKKSFESAMGLSLASFKRNEIDFYHYGTRLFDFFLPPSYSFLFQSLKEFKLQDTSSHFSNIVENTLSVGVLNFMLAVFFLMNVKNQTPLQKKNFKFLLLLAVFPLLLSLPPSIQFFSVSLPTPSALYPTILPAFRTLSRFGFITTFSLITMSGCAFDQLMQKMKTETMKRFAVLFILTFTVLESGNIHTLFFSDTTNVPSAYEQLKEIHLTKGKSILELPNSWGYINSYWSTYHQKPMFNTLETTSPNFQALNELKIKSVEDLLNFARTHNIEYILYHSAEPADWLSNPISNSFDETMLFYENARYSYLLKVPETSDSTIPGSMRPEAP